MAKAKAKILPPCPKCGGKMRAVNLVGRPSFYGCTNYPDCKGTTPIEEVESGLIIDPGYTPDDDDDDDWLDEI